MTAQAGRYEGGRQSQGFFILVDSTKTLNTLYKHRPCVRIKTIYDSHLIIDFFTVFGGHQYTVYTTLHYNIFL